MNKIALATGVVCAALACAPAANADAAQYVKTPWGTRCAVDANQVACETCVMGTHFCDPPGLVMTFDTSGVQAPGNVGITSVRLQAHRSPIRDRSRHGHLCPEPVLDLISNPETESQKVMR